jgi:homopolymeric O-antigen transport system permease protein
MSEKTPPVPLYDSSTRRRRPLEELQTLWAYRSLVFELIVRDIKVRYKRSVLGVAWTMLAPLLNMVALTIVFSAVLKTAIVNYPVYLLSGLVLWNFFSQTTSAAAVQTTEANEIAKRTFVPRSAFVASAIGVGLVNLLLSLIPLIAILLVTRFPLHAAWFLLPIPILLSTLFAAGVSLILFPVASQFSDVREMYLVAVQIWFFLTPVMYDLSIIPMRFRGWIFLNPMYYLLEVFRAPIYQGRLPDVTTMLIASGVATVSAAAGWIYFSQRADALALVA